MKTVGAMSTGGKAPQTPVTSAAVENSPLPSEPKLWVFIAAAIGIAALWWIIPHFIGPSGLEQPDNRGSFGDSFGSVNALFTGLAFAGLIYTIILQRHELRLQRRELEMTRQVMEDQKEELAKTAESQKTVAEIQRETAQIMREQSANQKLAATVDALKAALDILKNRIAKKSEDYAHLSEQMSMGTLIMNLSEDDQQAQLAHDLRAQADISSEIKRLRMEHLTAENALLAITKGSTTG